VSLVIFIIIVIARCYAESAYAAASCPPVRLSVCDIAVIEYNDLCGWNSLAHGAWDRNGGYSCAAIDRRSNTILCKKWTKNISIKRK